MVTQVYRLFDHVTVTIQLKGSDDHAKSLSFLLLGRRQQGATSGVAAVKLEKREMNFLNEIKMRQAAEAESLETHHGETNLNLAGFLF